MSSTSGAGPFFLGLTLLGGIISFAVYQVPQPWRGVLVTLILVMLTVGTFVLRLARHHYEYKRMLLTTRAPAPKKRRRKKAQDSRPKHLNVIQSSSAGGGRYVI